MKGFCKNCGKHRRHEHSPTQRKGRAKYCRACRMAGTIQSTYCRNCGTVKTSNNTNCESHEKYGVPSLPGSVFHDYDNDDGYGSDRSSIRVSYNHNQTLQIDSR